MWDGRLHQLVEANDAAGQAGPVGASVNAIAWQQTPPSMIVELLPSQRRFVVSLPRKAAQGLLQIALTKRCVYAIDQSGGSGSRRCQPGPEPGISATRAAFISSLRRGMATNGRSQSAARTKVQRTISGDRTCLLSLIQGFQSRVVESVAVRSWTKVMLTRPARIALCVAGLAFVIRVVFGLITLRSYTLQGDAVSFDQCGWMLAELHRDRPTPIGAPGSVSAFRPP